MSPVTPFFVYGLKEEGKEKMIVRTVGSYAAGDFNKPLFPLLLSPTNAQMLSLPPSLPPKLLSNVVVPKMMLHKNPSRDNFLLMLSL